MMTDTENPARELFKKRLIAALIDALILGVVNTVIGSVLASIGLQNIANLIAIILAVIYFGLLESSAKQASIGKQLMNLRVTSESGERLDRKQALIRAGWRLLAIVYFVQHLAMGRETAWHDQQARTQVSVTA